MTYTLNEEHALHASAIAASEQLTQIQLLAAATGSLANGSRRRIDGAAADLAVIAEQFASVVGALFSELGEATEEPAPDVRSSAAHSAPADSNADGSESSVRYIETPEPGTAPREDVWQIDRDQPADPSSDPVPAGNNGGPTGG